MLEALSESLGAAASALQLQRSLGFFFLWTMLSFVSEKLAPKQLKDLNERKRFSGRITSIVHSLGVIAMCVWILSDPEQCEGINADHLYGYSDSVALLFSLTCGYFIWDVFACLNKSSLNVGFLIHAVSCFLCYLFGQYPYLQYYGVRFLLFEISTPFLTVMVLLRQFGKMGKLHDTVQAVFGLTFFACRIFYGFPLSVSFFWETFQLWHEGKHHSSFVVVFYWMANCALNSLNIFWMFTMLSNYSKRSKKSN